MHAAGKTFVKTYLKAIRDTFYLNMWNFPICDIFIQQKGEVQTFRLAGRPPTSPVPSFSEASWFPHEENPEGGWCAYCIDLISKQKI